MLNLDNIDGLIKNIKIIIESKYLEKYNITDEKINFIEQCSKIYKQHFICIMRGE